MNEKWKEKVHRFFTTLELKTYELKGNQATLEGSCTIKSKHGKLPCRWFVESVVIIGADPNTVVIPECENCTKYLDIPSYCRFYEEATNKGEACFPSDPRKDHNNGGRAHFEFKVNKKIISKVQKIKIEIEKIRADARLHSQHNTGLAYMKVNDLLLNDITMTDYYPSRKEYRPISEPYGVYEVPKIWLNPDVEVQRITLEVNEKTMWDVDSVKLIVESFELNKDRIIGMIALFIGIIALILTLL